MRENNYLIGLATLCISTLLGGCSNIPLLDPKGPIGNSELILIGVSFALMLIVVIPVIVMAIWFPRRYKASNPNGDYDPKWSHSVKIDLVVWLVPAVIVTALGIITWKETHRLDPFEPINSTARPINIEAVSFDWKWLFIYPDQHIATVNHIEFPVNVPVSFKITSDTVMTSFFIPQLGSQIYAMGGKQSRLHLLANEPGDYFGQNQQFSGFGFSDMNFPVKVTSRKQFDAWVEKIQRVPDKLDLAQLEELRKPSTGFPITSFSGVAPGLFDHILSKYQTAKTKESGSYSPTTGYSEDQ
jgi:cytochrome o ubiquinol oxidase subunit 2